MSLQIVILGMLWEEESHPYDIKKRIQQYDLGNLISITDGALYYNFEALEKKSLLEKVEIVYSDNRPQKTMYRITNEGRLALKEEIYNSFKKNTDIKELSSSIAFMHLIDCERLPFLIEDIIEQLQEDAKQIDDKIRGLANTDIRTNVLFLAEFSANRFRYKIEWFRKLLEIIKDV